METQLPTTSAPLPNGEQTTPIAPATSGASETGAATPPPVSSPEALPVAQKPAEPVKITITLPTNAYFMSGIRDFTLALIKNMTKFPEQWAYRFQSVVDELCNNAIEHGSAPGKEITVIFLQNDEKSVQIMVEDSGTGKDKFNAAQLHELVAQRLQPDYAFSGIRGRGLAKIVSAWTDELTFTDLPTGGIRATITKRLDDPKMNDPTALPSTDPTHVLLTN
ncbi:hypothetical protein CO046_01930 [Candidatus Peregrinibacteria bacterium CG_4_9_14_0_2_um_filter_53_11]|nr:MAG: hypothetical protein CO046_01930 [Candidatus Peregrinibacteria bacterium CG_4_9_14_0_2_um_filter_53_11]